MDIDGQQAAVEVTSGLSDGIGLTRKRQLVRMKRSGNACEKRRVNEKRDDGKAGSRCGGPRHGVQTVP
jgi:hypothetical protein